MRTLVYPCFLTCAECTDDEYWKNVFEDLAFSITPHGVYISKDYIISHIKSKEFVYKINTDADPDTLFADIYGLFSEKLGIKSNQETEECRNTILEDTNELVFDSWNSIKRKSVRDSVILNYVAKKSTEYKLSIRKTRELLNAINLNILLKFVSNRQVQYENGDIVDIEGFTYDIGTFKFTPPPSTQQSVVSTLSDYCKGSVVSTLSPFEYNKTTVSMVDAWTKYMDSLSRLGSYCSTKC